MKRKARNARDAVLRKLEALLHWYRLKRARAAHELGRAARARRAQLRIVRQLRIEYKRHLLLVRSVVIGIGAFAAVAAIIVAGLWWRLSSGPISLDVVTPWLTTAVEKNLGGGHRIEVGGTVIERDAKGRTALRLRDIVVRDPAGEVLVRAPRAEIGISGSSLLLGKLRIASFLLVGANMEIRVETDGHVNVFAGGTRPFLDIGPVNAAPQPDGATPPPSSSPSAAPPPGVSINTLTDRGIERNVAALLAWVDGLGALGRDGNLVNVTGFDGYELSEVGVKNGSLVVDDARNARTWSFTEITLALTRPDNGGVAFNASSESEQRSWSLSAAISPLRGGSRALRLDADHVMLDHVLLALQLGDGQFHSTLPISAEVRAEIAPNGMPQVLRGRIVASGYLGDERNVDDQIAIEFAELRLDWDATRGTLLAPIQLISGANRLALYAQLTPPINNDGISTFTLHGGTVVLGPIAPDRDPLVLKRIAVRIRNDQAKQLLQLEQADIGTDDGSNVGLAITGTLDYSGPDPQLSLGLAGGQMSVSALKRLWPSFIAPRVRPWIMAHLFSGAVDHIEIAINTPWSTLPANGPTMTDEALKIDVGINNASLRPVDGLPVVRSADVTVHVTGRTATVKLGRGIAEISPGRRLVASNAVFELPDMHPASPPARVRFKLDGPVAAAAELMQSEKLRDFSGTQLDPATSRGTMSAQVALALPLMRDIPKGAINYNMNIDLNNFSAERMILNQRVEAQLLRITASNQSYQIKGDVKINGTPAQLEYRRQPGETDAEVRLQATLDEAARMRLGIDLGTAVVGVIPVKVGGRVGGDRDNKLTVEADLTASKIDNLLPGWVKPVGRPVRATFNLLIRDQSTRFEDIYVDGSGAMLRGTLELDSSNDIVSANLTTFALAEGDKATLKADRGTDATLHVVVRGDIFDGRTFIKGSLSGGSPDPKKKPRDVDVDFKVSRVLGFNGEALRSVELRFLRRGGQWRGFALNATLGRDTPIKGDLRDWRDLRDGKIRAQNAQVVYLDTNDAGALFRFTDIYPRMVGGRIWVLMDPPTADGSPQEGTLNIRDFTISNERELQPVLPNTPNVPHDNIVFSSLNVEFTRTPGRLAIKDGVVKGPVIGATIDGALDYQRDEVRLRGTFVPLYALNSMFSNIPIINLFAAEGVFGITYEVVGSPSQPTLRINPASALAPGILRKFFAFQQLPQQQ